MERLFYSWVPILVILGVSGSSMFRGGGGRTALFASPTLVLKPPYRGMANEIQ